MKHKVLFVDLDGTLLCDDKSISDKNRLAIERMLGEGHYFVIATGRSIESGRMIARQLGLGSAGCYITAFNGGLLYDCAADRVLYKKTLPVEVVQELFIRTDAAGLYAHTYNKSDVITSRHTKELDFYCTATGSSYRISENVLDMLDEEPPKVIVMSLEDEKKLQRFRKKNMSWEKGRCTSVFTSRQLLEYCPIGSDKGTGLTKLIEILNLPAECTVAVGDEENDIPMVKAANVGVAMTNGIDAIKKAADYVTENDNNHDAIAEIIEKFIL
jgi:hypothetical protein